MTTEDDHDLRDPAADRRLFAELRAMWEHHDPVPEGLVTSVILGIASSNVDAEYEVLTLLDATDRLAGVRGTSDTRTLTFSSPAVTVLLRVSEMANGRRRLDGWVSPPAVMAVRVISGVDQVDTMASAAGRFEVAEVPPGVATVRLEALGDPASPAGPLRLTTPPFVV